MYFLTHIILINWKLGIFDLQCILLPCVVVFRVRNNCKNYYYSNTNFILNLTYLARGDPHCLE